MPNEDTDVELNLSDAEWRDRLTPEQFRVCREKGTERAFAGKYDGCSEPGVYKCVACGNALFDSDTKFNSGTGWPSFYDAARARSVTIVEDTSLGMARTEVLCQRCESHLGHVFDDGPSPTHMRYCINSVALELTPRESPPSDQ